MCSHIFKHHCEITYVTHIVRNQNYPLSIAVMLINCSSTGEMSEHVMVAKSRHMYSMCCCTFMCEQMCVSVCVWVHTHSWPSHSCVRASSGCRSDAHPGRRVSPALWIPPWVLPSASRTASHSCIAPLQVKVHTHKHWGQRSTILRHKGNRCLTWFVFFSGRSVTASHS